MRKRKNITRDFYSLDNILKTQSSYYLIIGERSNGKTYSVKKRVLEKWARGEGKFLYIRRRHKSITRNKLKKIFGDMRNVANEVCGGQIDYSAEQGFYVTTPNGVEIIGQATSIEDGIDFKGVPFEEITTILFDEFLDYSYMQDEVNQYLNLVSTIVRERKNVEIFMLGNTIARFCPYFEEFGIDASKLLKGRIHLYSHRRGVKIALEYCKSRVAEVNEQGEKVHKYLGFDSSNSVKMILYGEFDQKTCTTTDIDGIGWKCQRRIINAYLTYVGEVFEMSLYENKNPILFVRRINTQCGKVGKNIRYNISVDNSLVLTNVKGIVPSYNCKSKFMDPEIQGLLDIAKLCFNCKRVVYDNDLTGTEFDKISANI